MVIFGVFKMAATAILEFFKFQNFNGRNGQERPNASLCQISLKSVEPRSKYGDFLTFQDGSRRHLEFF